MRLSTPPAGFFRLVAATSVAALAAVPSPAVAEPGAASVIGAASFEAGTTTITVPYSGPAPHAQLFRISGTHYYYEFTPARLFRPMVFFKRVGTPVERFTLANRPTGHSVRLSFTLTRPGRPSLQLDEAAHVFRIRPMGAPTASSFTVRPAPTPRPIAPTPEAAVPRHTGTRTAIGRPFLDSARGMLIVPFRGAEPEYHTGVLESDHRWVYFDFENSQPMVGSRPYGRFADEVFVRWAMALRPKRAAVRLSVRLSAPRSLSAEVHPEVGQIWLMVPERFPTSQLSSTGEPVPPAMLPFPIPSGISTPTPVTPEGSPLPSPEPSLAPSPEPTPLPSAELERPQVVITPPPVHPSPRPTPKPTPKPHVAIATRFTNAYYDHSRQALVVTYSGAVPAYGLQALSPTSMVLEFPHTALTKKGTLVQAFSYHPVLTRWMAKGLGTEGAVQVTFNTAGPGEVLVAVDPAHHQLLLLPQLQGTLELPPNMPASAGTSFGRAYYDPGTGAVVLPYHGQTPLYAIEPVSASYLYLDFINAGLDLSGIQYENLGANPGLTFWLLGCRPQQNTVRMALNLPYPGYVRVLDDRANQRLLLVPTKALPSPAPTPNS